MPSDQQKRDIIKQEYPWPSWEAKVDKMSDKQVHATYIRIISKKK